MHRNSQKNAAYSYVLPALMMIAPATLLAALKSTDDVRPGTVLYKKLSGESASELKGLNSLLNSKGLPAEKTLPNSGITIATFNGKGREKAIAKILKHSGLVEFAEADQAMAPSAQPNDPSFGAQWHHNNINSQQAWDITSVTDNAGALASGNYAYRVQAYKDGEVSAYSNTFELRLK